MVMKKSDVIVYFRDMPKNRKHWGMFFTMGFLMIVLGFFAIGYALFGIPSTLLLHRVGARRWIARLRLSRPAWC